MKYFFIISLFICVTAQKNIKLSSDIVKENAVSFKLLHSLDGGEEGYYNRVSSSYSPNGKIVVADQGNKELLIYDKNFKLIDRFGKEGTGPGEIDAISKIKATKERIYVSSHTRLLIFDYQGNAKNEIRLYENGQADIVISDKNILFIYASGKYKSIKYDIDGKKLSEKLDESYEEVKDQSGNRMIMRISSSSEKYQAYNGGYVSSARGEYKISLLDKNFKELATLHRDFERVPRDFSKFKFSFKVEGVSKKEQAQMAKAAQAQMRSQLGEFKDDIRGILGIHKGYIFASISNEDDEALLIDIISSDNKLYSQVELPSKKDRDLLSAEIKHGKLLVCFKNEETGPFVNVYDIVFN